MKADPESLRKLLAAGKVGKRVNVGVLQGTPIPLPLKTPEKDFTKLVGEFAQAGGWLVLHIRKVGVGGRRGKKHWLTPTMFDGVGFPDLCVLRPPRLVIAELKSGYNSPEPEQEVWLDAWRRLPGAEVYVWKPPEWPEIVRVLT